MKKEELIKKVYAVFSKFRKPVQCTEYTDFEDAEFNPILLSATRRNLTIEQIGTVGWGPIPSMNPEALAYFMPRLIELAVTKVIDSDGDPFFCLFINAFHRYQNDERFRLFGIDQKDAMVDTFKYLCQHYQEQLEYEGWLSEAQQAIIDWSRTQQMRGPDGMKIAVLRKCRANLTLIWAAAHAKRSANKLDMYIHMCIL